ncbi:MAG: hypothetical protein KTR28_07520 [Micavibrio sp.]|nr:hypothetical protein [Micavibrio sp.]
MQLAIKGKQFLKQFSANEMGVTLIDATILLIVAGIVATPLIQQYKNYVNEQTLARTDGAMTSSQDAIEIFFFDNKHYPCPADPTLGPNDTNFGFENRDTTTGDCIYTGTPEVIRGMVPFKTLQLRNEEALDYWKNKLEYAVTVILTKKDTFGNGNGGKITVQTPSQLDITDNDCSPSAPEEMAINGVHMLILSHGENGSGAYTNEGAFQSCPPNLRESENCDNDETYITHACNVNLGDNGDFLDDRLMGLISRWNETRTTLFNNNEDKSIGSEAGYFGINNDLPEHPIDVIGNIKATSSLSSGEGDNTKTGSVLSSEFCDSNGSNCFRPQLITGNEPKMKCNNNVARGISNGQVRCLDSLPDITEKSCPDGEFVTSIDSEGNVTCEL